MYVGIAVSVQVKIIVDFSLSSYLTRSALIYGVICAACDAYWCTYWGQEELNYSRASQVRFVMSEVDAVEWA